MVILHTSRNIDDKETRVPYIYVLYTCLTAEYIYHQEPRLNIKNSVK
jgi:hypothetical protein